MNLTSYSVYRPRSDAGRFIKAKIDEALLTAMEEWGVRVLEVAQQYCPVDTGELVSSGHVVVNEAPPTVAVVFDAPYSQYVEFGTGIRGAASPGAGDGPYNPNWPGMVAQPFLRPAFDELKGEAPNMTKAKVTVALR
jgi:HK97 gp10 family phage protein